MSVKILCGFLLLTGIVINPGCAGSQKDIDLDIREDRQDLAFHFELRSYWNWSLAEEINGDIERVIVKDGDGNSLAGQIVRELAVYSTLPGTPVIRVCLDKALTKESESVSLSALVYLNNQYYILYGAAERQGSGWKRKDLPSYGLMLWVFPRLKARAKEASLTKTEIDPRQLFLGFRLWPTEIYRGDKQLPNPWLGSSRWFVRAVLDKHEVILGKQLSISEKMPGLHQRARTLEFHIPEEQLIGRKDIWLVLRGVMDRPFVFKWHLLLNENGKWILAEEPDYGEVFKSAMGLSTDPVAQDDFWEDQANQ